MFKKILVPLDGSEASTRALHTAVEMAQVHGSELYLVYVVSVDLFENYEIPDGRTDKEKAVEMTRYTDFADAYKHESLTEVFKEYKTGQGMQFLGDVKATIPEGIKVECSIEVGVPKEAILAVAKKEDTDLIVMGRQGMSAVKRIFVGSVTTYVMANAECPVLVVK